MYKIFFCFIKMGPFGHGPLPVNGQAEPPPPLSSGLTVVKMAWPADVYVVERRVVFHSPFHADNFKKSHICGFTQFLFIYVIRNVS